MKKKVNQQNARPGVYGDVIDNIAKQDICPFCEEHLKSIHPHPLEERAYWFITENAYPYEPKKQHFLLIHKDHVEHVSELKEEALSELFSVVKELTLKQNMAGGTLMLRFGDSKFTGASVTHLHAHLFQSDPDASTYDPKKGVVTRVG